jgi:hypothetical protein
MSNPKLRPETRNTKQCDKCHGKVKITIFDSGIRSYCTEHQPHTIELGNCYVCGRPSSDQWIYRVGFGVSEAETVDQYYATCCETHYQKIDAIITRM